jgi:hypothetical protein
MGLDQRTHLGATILYAVAAISLAHILVGYDGSRLFLASLGSGLVDTAIELGNRNAPLLAELIEVLAIAAFIVFGYLIERRFIWAGYVAAAFLVFDAVVCFSMAPSLGLGLPASLLVAVHAVYFLGVLNAGNAVRQYYENERTVRRLDLEAGLKRRLETFGGSPPAPNFPRYRPTPPP